MQTPAAVSSIALHWPLLEREILWKRRSTWRAALELLAIEQHANGGFPVQLGRSWLLELGDYTEGEAASLQRALSELEARRVVTRAPRAGRTPSTWTIQPDLRRWRQLTWMTSATHAESLFLSHRCRALRASRDHLPDQSVFLRSTSAEIVQLRAYLENRNGLSSGVTICAVHGNRAECSERCAQGLVFERNSTVDLLGKSSAGRAPLLSSTSDKSEGNSLESNYASHPLFTTAARVCRKPKLWGAPARQLEELINRWSSAEVETAIAWLNEADARGRKFGPVSVVEDLAGLEGSPLFRANAAGAQ